MITLDDVTLTFADGAARLTAVDRVSMTGKPGIVTGITGPLGLRQVEHPRARRDPHPA